MLPTVLLLCPWSSELWLILKKVVDLKLILHCLLVEEQKLKLFSLNGVNLFLKPIFSSYYLVGHRASSATSQTPDYFKIRLYLYMNSTMTLTDQGRLLNEKINL